MSWNEHTTGLAGCSTLKWGGEHRPRAQQGGESWGYPVYLKPREWIVFLKKKERKRNQYQETLYKDRESQGKSY